MWNSRRTVKSSSMSRGSTNGPRGRRAVSTIRDHFYLCNWLHCGDASTKERVINEFELRGNRRVCDGRREQVEPRKRESLWPVKPILDSHQSGPRVSQKGFARKSQGAGGVDPQADQ